MSCLAFKFSRLLGCALFAALAVGCDVDTSSSDSGSSSGSSTSGSALSFGGYSFSYSCPSGVSNTTTIPRTSTSTCARVYERYAEELGCNNIDNYDSLVSQYQSCLNQDIAACNAAPNDPNCAG